MANGTGLMGNNSTSQSALIVKRPGSNSIYYVFTLDQAGQGQGLNYSEVDMSLAAGMGSVTAKNIPVFSPTTEKLCGVMHNNGIDTWVVSHDRNSADFRAILVTSAGVNATPTISSVGTAIGHYSATLGCMKISPNGKKLGLAIYAPAMFELYDFNASTGVVSNQIQLPLISQANSYAYGCEFSPDGSKFYGTNEDWKTISGPDQSFISYNFSSYKLHQWDLCAGSAGGIVASRKTIIASEAEQLQLAPDGKIYVARSNSLPPQPGTEIMLGVINNPNAAFPAINYVNTGQSIFPNICRYGIPNFIAGFYKTPVAQYTYTVDPAISCLTATFTAPPMSSNTCAATSYTVHHFVWDFDDPAPGAANTSTLANPTHVYPGNGVYNAKLILYNQDGGVIDTLKRKVNVQQVSLAPPPSGFSVCAGESITLTASGGASTYTWSTGAGSSVIVVSPSVTTSYTVQSISPTGCPLKTVQQITVHAAPSITIDPPGSFCLETALTLTARGANSYTWVTGMNGPVLKTIANSTTSVYSVKGNSNGCVTTTTISVNILPLPSITVNNAQPICIGFNKVQPVVLTASGASSYTWNNGKTGSPTTFSLVEEFAYEVKGVGLNGCIATKTGTIMVNYLPYVSADGGDTICSKGSIKLTAHGAATYSWSNGASSAVAEVSPSVSTIYTVTGKTTAGCSNSASVAVIVRPTPTLTAGSASTCGGVPVVLSVASESVPGVNYSWSPGAQSGNTIQTAENVTTVYTVVAKSAGGCADSVNVSLFITPVPDLHVGPSVSISPGGNVSLKASGGSTYTWNPVDGLSCVNCDSPVASPITDMQYCVSAGEGMCTTTVCLDVVVTCETEKDFSVPNAFTPNGDGINDAFCLQGWDECTSDFKVIIFDRWGEKVFESGDPAFCWNGMHKGEVLNTGVFVYVIQAKKFKGDNIDKKGNITLIR